MIDVVIIEDLENYIYGYGSWVFNILCGISFGCCCEVFVASYTSCMLCGVLPFDNIYVYLSKKKNYHNYDIYIFFLLCEKVFEIDILFLPFTISMQCLLLIKTYVDVLVFCNVLSLQLVFWHRLLTLGLQGSECVIWAKALQSEHNLCRVIWVAENTLDPQLLEKVPEYYLCSIGQSFKLYLAQQLIL